MQQYMSVLSLQEVQKKKSEHATGSCSKIALLKWQGHVTCQLTAKQDAEVMFRIRKLTKYKFEHRLGP